MLSNLMTLDQVKHDAGLIPVFPKATELIFHTGNTLSSMTLAKKTNKSITEEIIECIATALQRMKLDGNENQFQNETYVKFLPLSNESLKTFHYNGISLDNELLTREDLKYSVKIFLRSLDPKLLNDTIEAVLTQLKEDYIESVVISLPKADTQITINEFLPLWRIVESYMDKQKILSAGICDFMLPLLSDLYDSSKHKPSVNQINLSVCCSIPEELKKFAKEHNIQLLTHSDPIDILNETDFQEVIRHYCHEYDSMNWKPLSIVRYNSLITKRGIIKAKGFFIYAKREL